MEQQEFFDKIDTPKLGTIIDKDTGIDGIVNLIGSPVKFVAMRFTFQDKNGTKISTEFKHEDYIEDESDDWMEDDEYITKEDLDFLDNPSIKITYGINNKKSYYDLDKIYDYLIKVRKSLSNSNKHKDKNDR